MLFTVLFTPVTASAYLPDSVGMWGNYGRTPGGIVDLRTGEIVAKVIKTEYEAIARYFPDVFDEAIAVFTCESGVNQFRRDGSVVTSPTSDYGVSQINKIHLKKSKELGQDIFTLNGNLGFARYLYDIYGWSPWVCKKALIKNKDLFLASSQR